jgi:hypothetical protein
VISGDAVSVTGTAAYADEKAENGKTITVNSFALSGAQKDNYSLLTTTATVTGNITARQITLTLDGIPPVIKEYDGTDAATLAAGNYNLQNIESGDDVSVTGTATYNDAKTGSGKTITVNSFVLSGVQKDNYQLLTNTATVSGTITAKPLTITLNNTPLITKVYDKTISATLSPGNYSLTGIVNSDAVSVTGTAAYADEKAENDKTITVNSFVLSGADKDNYTISPSPTLTVTGDITAKPISLTLNSVPLISKVYNGTLSATLATANYALSGVESGDEVDVSGNATYDNGDKGTGKTITVNDFVLSGAQKNNYQLSTTLATTTGNITAMPVSVTAEAKDKTYGDTDPSFTYSFTPVLISGDVFTGALTRTAGENVGPYAIQQGTLALSSNYTLSYTPASLTINSKTISVTAEAKDKTYGDADPLFTYSFTPVLVSGDVFTGTLTRTAGENTGPYQIQQGSLSLSSNYALAYTPADLTINAKTIHVTADALSKTYGDSDPVLTYGFTPILVSGDVFTGALTRTSGEHAGTYPITVGTLALSSNYALSFTGTDFTIDARQISVTADAKSKTYGDADPELTYQFSPALISGDAFTGTITRTTGEEVGAYPINQGSLTLSSDYALNYTAADLTIEASANADLTSLVLSSGTLSPVFDAATQTYSVTVSHTTTSIALTPTAAMEISTIKVNGITVASGAASGDITLNPGANAITVMITAQDGTTQKEYTINVNRIAVSSDADLSALELDPGTLQPGFHTDSLSYTVAIAQDVASVVLTPTAVEAASVIDVNGSITSSGNPITIATSTDVTMVTLTVTAEDGITQKVYTLQLVKPVTTWTGAADNNWINIANWTNGVPDLIKLAVIANVQPRPLVSSNQSVMNLTINQGAAVSLAANLEVAGNLVNNGTLSGTGALVFNGNVTQQISGTGRIGNMTNDNSNGLTIASGAGNAIGITGILTLHTGNLATGDNLVLVSDSLGTAALAPLPAGASVTGNVTVERWMLAQRGYRTMGHPFKSALPLSQLEDDFSISGSGTGFVTGLGYSTASVSYYDSVGVNPPAFKRPLSNAPNTTSTPVWTTGRGILALVRGKGNEGLGGTYADVTQPSAFAADATGELNQGAVEYKLGANAVGTSFNLVGNPYAAPINIRLLKSNNGAAMNSNNGSAGIGNTIYVYNPHKNAGISATPSQEVRGGIDAYTNDGTTDIIIPSFGAFFVQAKAAGNIIAFDENVKAVDQQPITIMGGSPSRLTLSLENNRGSWDDIKIRWDKEAGAEGTDSYDGAKMHNELLDLYSITSDNKQLCIDSRSDSFNREEIIPLGISTEVKDPSFRFRVSAYEMPANIQVYLRDKLLNTETLLSAINDIYGFAITSDSLSKGDKRFELVIRFRKEAPVPVDDVSAGVKITPNPFRNELLVQLGAEARSSGITQVRLISMNGTVVKTTKAAANASMIRVNIADLAAGVYFAEVTNDKVRTIKQVIRQ